MKNNMELPKNLDELKQLSDDALLRLWDKYFAADKRKMRKSMYRPLWYRISCDRMKLRLHQKHITRLNHYSTDPEQCIEKSIKTKYHLKNGMEMVKTYKSREYIVKVVSRNEFLYDGQIYKTLSAVAKKICNKKVSGYDFFGLNNKTVNDNRTGGEHE